MTYVGQQERMETSHSFVRAVEKASGDYGEVPPDFRQMVVSALLKRRIDVSAMSATELNGIVAALWSNGTMQDAWSAEQALDPADPNFITASQLEKVMDDALFSPGNSPDPALVKQGVTLLSQQGRSLTSEQQAFVVTGGAGNASDVRNIIISVAQGLGVDPALALAIAWQESGLNPNAIGDDGHSVGLFQLHDQGEGAGMSVAEREDPRRNAEISLAQVAAVAAAHPDWSPGQIAAAAQRPADQAGYAAAVDGLYGEVKAGKLPTTNYTNSTSGAAGVAALAAQYPGVEGEFTSMFGRKPTFAEMSAMIAHGTDPAQVKDFVRSLPSHMPGLNQGQYKDLRSTADAVSQELFGHLATDGIVKELFDRGDLSRTAVKFFYTQLDIAGKMDPKTYNAIFAANQPHMQAIYNEHGFDPRVAAAQHAAATQSASSDATMPDSDAAAVADAMALPSVDEVPGLTAPTFADLHASIPQTPPPDETPGYATSRDQRGSFA